MNVVDEYFEWLYDYVCGDRYSEKLSYRKLLTLLHEIEFIYLMPNDENRAKNGINLRWIFSLKTGVNYDEVQKYIDGPCSVLEMLIALAMSCEDIMDDPLVGDRTGQWFWRMITNLGLGSMFDSRFDEHFVEDVISKFLYREYEPNGKGGLFTIRGCDVDLRNVEIWHQLCWYLDSIV